ncbi:MAG: zinc-dependent metalloprotease, partial [Gemmatimonadota bacterium]|nr:zinc-dependent metalloprotease [Gemmatimonadota bacterium]
LSIALVAGLLTLPSCRPGQANAAPAPEARGAQESGSSRSAGAGRRQGPKPYTEVISEDADTDQGLFTVHKVDDKFLFEIPDSLLGLDMLLISRIAGVPPGLGGYIPAGSAAGRQLVRFERTNNTILLRRYESGVAADDSLPIYQSVISNNFAPIIGAFEIEARTDSNDASVVDVTDFFEDDTPSLSGLRASQRRDYQVRRLDGDRSFISYIRSFPFNVNVRHTLTYDAGNPPGDQRTGTISTEMHQSLVLLPTDPMMPRYADDRIGYFSVERVNYGLDEQKAASERFIRRWRLEPSDPEAYARGELVDPVKPIVYYVDPATPERWREAVRQGVENWQAAFETAGFSNAIIAMDPPNPEEDPEWDPEDVRYSVVRWAASLTRNAQGPSTSDPRTGEIIESDIVWYHNHMRSYRNWMMVQTGAANPGARSLPISDELMAEAMEQVITHEIGHAIGLPHNMIASSAYPVDSLRSKTFASEMGVAPTIMDYARQNYIAQPEDGLEPKDFLRRIGPYDHYAVNWGYRIMPGVDDPEDELDTLDDWIVERADDPMFRFLSPGGLGVSDPRAQTEDMGDDPVLANNYGMSNLRRIVPNLVGWTTKPGEDYDDLAEIYGEALSQWQRYVGHVLTVVAGVHVDLKTADQDGPVYDGLPRQRQKEAMEWLAREVFEAPTWLNDPAILEKVGPRRGGFERLSARQASILNRLLDPRRMSVLVELQSSDEDPYPLVEFLDDVRQGVWGDLSGPFANDPYRRALQRAYLARMEYLLTEQPASNSFQGPAPNMGRSEVRPLVRMQLNEISARASRAASRARDRSARAHLEDVVARIEAILDRD